MPRYKGKREEHHQAGEEKGSPWQKSGDPFQDAPGGVGDPFAEEPPAEKPAPAERWRAYWNSGKGKILVTVLGCLAVFAIVVTVVLRMWIKPPSLPVQPAEPQTPVTTQPADPADTEPAGPTDDELYPDDGYNGDMPTVSGNRKEGVYTFLLVGTDMDDGNTDTLMVVTYDTREQDINIMSIPRDTMINEKWDIKKINSVYSRTGRSIDSLMNRIQKLIGFKPDFYVKVDLEMFVELIDLVDGVEFDVPRDMDYDDDWQDLHIHLKKGVQTLNGKDAMGLVRFRRYPEGDIQRVEVQQNFIKALIKECLSLKHWGKIKAYIDLAMKNVETDLELGSVVWFAGSVLGINGVPALNMEDVYTCTLPGNYGAGTYCRTFPNEKDPQSYVTIYPKKVVELVNERFNPYEQRVTTGMLDAMSILSNGDIASSTGTLKDQTHNGWMAVRRGEAYYDGDGNVVYGKPPAKPEQDAQGNWFITDEDGNVVYTDEAGNPLTDNPILPPSGEDPEPGQPVTLPTNPADGNPSGGGPGDSSGQAADPGQTEPDTPEDPALPPAGSQGEPGLPEDDGQPDTPPEEEEPVLSEKPDWLRTDND